MHAWAAWLFGCAPRLGWGNPVYECMSRYDYEGFEAQSCFLCWFNYISTVHPVELNLVLRRLTADDNRISSSMVLSSSRFTPSGEPLAAPLGPHCRPCITWFCTPGTAGPASPGFAPLALQALHHLVLHPWYCWPCIIWFCTPGSHFCSSTSTGVWRYI